MLTFGDFDAWLECAGEKMAVYDTKVDATSREVTCFVLAEEGKVSVSSYLRLIGYGLKSISVIATLPLCRRRSRYTGRIGVVEWSRPLILNWMETRFPGSSYTGEVSLGARG